MVKIRLKRVGRRNRPCYRIVVADTKTKRDGKVIENIGQYDPIKQTENVKLNKERAEYWIGVGAQVADGAAPLLRRQGVKC